MAMKTKVLALALFGWLAIGAKDCTGWGWSNNGYEGYTTGSGSGDQSCGPIQGQGGMSGGGLGAGGASLGSGSVGVGGGYPGDPSPQGLTCGGGDDASFLEGYVQDADPAGGVSCANPSDCSTKCFANSKYCVEHAVHPYKPPMVGDLYQCIDTLPPASLGGSYTCLYQYPNADACIFAYAAKLGPITFPAPPPLCVYKSP
jgi:hypothetical protein